jgi:hypothetical protein
MFDFKDYQRILSDDIYVFEKYRNKTLSVMASDRDDDGSILYIMNEHGYRSDSFKTFGDYNILTLGCSWTMGIGVENSYIWTNILKEKFQKKHFEKNVKLYNYSSYGVSTKFVAKNYYKIIKAGLIPDLTIIMWPGFSRRDYLKSDGTFKKIGGFRMANGKDDLWKNEEEDIKFIELRNDYQDLMEFWESYKFVETTSQLYNTKVIHTIAGYYYEIFESIEKNLTDLIKYETFFRPNDCYKSDCLARDKRHPGKEWHSLFAEKINIFINDNKI